MGRTFGFLLEILVDKENNNGESEVIFQSTIWIMVTPLALLALLKVEQELMNFT